MSLLARGWIPAPVRELAVRALARGRGVPRTVNGVPVRVEAATRYLFLPDYDRSVAAVLRERIVPGCCAWNVGAHVGIHVLQLGALVGPHGRVVAFEPNPAAMKVLRANVHLNALDDRVEMEPVAIGSSTGEVDFYAFGTDGMSRLGSPNPLLTATRRVTVAVTTLDEVAARRQECPAWVVMDIEGWEIAALQAARRLLRRSAFIVEMHPTLWPSSGHSRTDLERLLQEFGLEAIPLTGQADPLSEYGHVFIDARDA